MPVPGFCWTAGHRPLGRAEALEAQVLNPCSDAADDDGDFDDGDFNFPICLR